MGQPEHGTRHGVACLSHRPEMPVLIHIFLFASLVVEDYTCFTCAMLGDSQSAADNGYLRRSSAPFYPGS